MRRAGGGLRAWQTRKKNPGPERSRPLKFWGEGGRRGSEALFSEGTEMCPEEGSLGGGLSDPWAQDVR